MEILIPPTTLLEKETTTKKTLPPSSLLVSTNIPSVSPTPIALALALVKKSRLSDEGDVVNDTKPLLCKKPIMSIADIAAANEAGKLYIVFKGHVYDMTSFQHKHPGGPLVMNDVKSTDATDAMTVLHPKGVLEKYLPTFHVGTVSNLTINFEEVEEEIHNPFLFSFINFIIIPGCY